MRSQFYLINNYVKAFFQVYLFWFLEKRDSMTHSYKHRVTKFLKNVS